MEHLVGRFDSGNPGPTLIVVGGVHGSEPAGVKAGERVLERISDCGATLCGRVVFLRGNVDALAAGCRYIDMDLNRMWQPERVEAVLTGNTHETVAEHKQMRGLVEALKECFASAEGPVFFLDLHSTSSETIPFFWLVPGGATEVITHFGMPSVYDPMEKIEGTLGQWVAAQGHRVLLAEAGQHEDSSAVDHCEAIIWITLVHAELVAEHALQPKYARSQELLHSACDTQEFFNIVYHHKIGDGDDFAMRPGYRSFQAIRAGELLAHDKNGEIRAQSDGRILMPLYKPPCDDGFLIVQEDSRPPHF